MDAENDNDQPNSSSASASASSSNNSSSSNLLGHLPMLPFMRSTDDDEPDIDGEEASTAAASDGNDNDLNEEPMPLQPPVTAAAATAVAQTASASQQQPTLAPITTTASTSATANATATSSAATINSSSVGREEPMQNHQNSPPPQPPTQLQQAPNIETATPPPPTTTTQSVSASSSATLQQQFAAADLSQLDQEHHQLTAQINNRSAIADTIDASAVIVQPLEANAEHPQHPHLYPQEAANSSEELEQPPNDIQLDDNDNNDFDVDLNLQNDDVLVNATTANHQQPERQQSLSLDTTASGSSGTSSSGQQQQQQRQQTPQPPTTLPSLLQQQQQIQQQDVEELETEESKHLPSYDHHYHNNPNNYQHLHSNLYQHSSGVYPYGNRQSSELTHSNGAHNTNYNHNLFGNTMSSLADRNHGSTAGLAGHASGSNNEVVDRLKMLYPNVNENETPLPRCWSPHDKCLSIGLSQNNLRVHFKGKQSNDAASVRTAHPIPPSCGIYYFEVKIISKGKNGYMGIGLTAQQFRMNRLPGWDKQSYGYHGDDGNSFSSSGHGQSYGPTFTTGDIIGCCVNFVNNTCFYTKNGVDLGIAFRELPTKLYPTVGLQTPGEEVDANFGQEPFKFTQIEEMMKQMRDDVKTSIYDFPLPAEQGDPTTLLQRMVHSYLVHNGYSQTAEAFARQNAAQSRIYMEDMPSIRNRQKILKLVMSGKMSQAIDLTIRSYPDLLKNNENLWFMLKCRQFVEMINGSDVEYCPSSFPSFSTTANKTTNSITTQTSASNQTSVIQSTKSYQNGNGPNPSSNGSATADSIPSTSAATKTTTNTTKSSSNTTNATTITSTTTTINNAQNSTHIAVINTDIDLKTQSNLNEHCITSNDEDDPIKISKSNNDNDYINDVEMENNGHTNGNSCKNGNANIFNDSLDADEEMDIDCPLSARKNSQGIQRVLDFGRELMKMGERLERENKISDEEKQMLHDAFSLIAYSNPWAGPVGWQLCPSKRETVCRSLNSAILESLGCPKMAPLETCVAHANELLKTMSQASLGASAFVNINDVFPKN